MRKQKYTTYSLNLKLPVKTNLVVDDHMYGTVCGVIWEIRQVEGLVNHTLASKSSIAMEKNAHGPLPLENGTKRRVHKAYSNYKLLAQNKR